MLMSIDSIELFDDDSEDENSFLRSDEELHLSLAVMLEISTNVFDVPINGDDEGIHVSR